MPKVLCKELVVDKLCTVFFCKAVGGGDLLFSSEKVRPHSSKKFGGKEVQNASSKKVRWAKLLCQSSTGRVPKNFGGKKVQKASSRKVQEAKLLRQSSTTKFEKSSVEKKFKMLVPEKFGGPNCSARAAQQSSKKSSVEKKVQSAGSRKVRWANKPGQQGSKTSSTAKRLYKPYSKNIQAEEATSKKVQPQRFCDPGGTSKVSSGFFFEIHHCQRSFGELFLKPTLTLSKSIVFHYLLCLSLTCRRATTDNKDDF